MHLATILSILNRGMGYEAGTKWIIGSKWRSWWRQAHSSRIQRMYDLAKHTQRFVDCRRLSHAIWIITGNLMKYWKLFSVIEWLSYLIVFRTGKIHEIDFTNRLCYAQHVQAILREMRTLSRLRMIHLHNQSKHRVWARGCSIQIGCTSGTAFDRGAVKDHWMSDCVPLERVIITYRFCQSRRIARKAFQSDVRHIFDHSRLSGSAI